jgi:hypothetical protein
MSLCDPDAELRCGTLDCSEPDHPRRAHEGVPWDALEQSVFGAKAAGAQQIHSVRDIQVGPGRAPPRAAAAVVRRGACAHSRCRRGRLPSHHAGL